MKKLLRILTAVFLIAVTALSFTACDSENSKTSKSGLLYKKFKGDDFYTVYGYKGDADKTSVDIGELNDENVRIGRIKANAFSGDDTLVEVIVPTSVTEIDAGAFAKMKKLEKITLPFIGANANADAYYGETDKTEDKAVDAKRTFGYIFGTEEYDGGASVTNKYGKESATYYIPATLFQVIVKPENDYEIPMYAFNGLTQIESVGLSEKVIAIGENAFEDFTTLRNIVIPKSVKNIYKNAFKNASKLGEGLKFDEGVAFDKIWDNSFEGSAIKELKVSVKEIGESAFANCTELTKVELKDVVTLGAFAFYGCENLKDTKFSLNGYTQITQSLGFPQSAFPFQFAPD